MFFCTIIQLYYCTFDIERSRAYASPALFRRLSQGSLPTRAGSPLVGRDLHPLDDTQSFMKASPPPIPFDQQSLVALNFLYAGARRSRIARGLSAVVHVRDTPATAPPGRASWWCKA